MGIPLRSQGDLYKVRYGWVGHRRTRLCGLESLDGITACLCPVTAGRWMGGDVRLLASLCIIFCVEKGKERELVNTASNRL